MVSGEVGKCCLWTSSGTRAILPRYVLTVCPTVSAWHHWSKLLAVISTEWQALNEDHTARLRGWFRGCDLIVGQSLLDAFCFTINNYSEKSTVFPQQISIPIFPAGPITPTFRGGGSLTGRYQPRPYKPQFPTPQ